MLGVAALVAMRPSRSPGYDGPRVDDLQRLQVRRTPHVRIELTGHRASDTADVLTILDEHLAAQGKALVRI